MDMVVTLALQGKYDTAKDLSRKALDLDPANFFARWAIAWAAIEAGKFTEAIPELKKVAETESGTWFSAWLGYAYGASGDRARATAVIEDLNRRSVHGYVPPFNLSIAYLGLADRARALDGLERAYEAHSQQMVFLKMDRIFDPLRSEPRFIALMKKLRFDK
jgi:tetratricopeptide (TPR) repeat protein